MFRPRFALLLVTALIASHQLASAENAYSEIPLDQLTITEGKLPNNTSQFRWDSGRSSGDLPAYVVLDGDGECFLGEDIGPRGRNWRPAAREGETPSEPNPNALAICAPKGKAVTGSLFLPNDDLGGMTEIRFSVPAAKADAEARKNFLLTKEAHYQHLVEERLPGGAWFRRLAREARQERTGKSEDDPIGDDDVQARETRGSDVEQTFAVFSGGRAVSENLQLDRMLRPAKPEEPTVDLSSLPGITVAEMDWDELIEGIAPELDPLSKVVPHDQYALFFPSFQALVTMVDESTAYGSPLLTAVQDRSEDAQTRERYEKQLCLSLDTASRMLGPMVVKSVAVTGSDPNFRTGTDVAAIFETTNATTFAASVIARQAAAAKQTPDCQKVSGKVGSLDYQGVVSPHREICSYLATVGNAVIVTNSLNQLEQLAEVASGKLEPLSSLKEYKFFRHRYDRTSKDETAFLMVTDVTIRSWCSPRWRIAASRRTRAAAIMSEHQAKSIDQLVAGEITTPDVTTNLHVTDLGTLQLTKAGVVSSTYGTLAFLTPISELQFEKVTKTEADAYKRWRNRYQDYWRQFFDPIGVQFAISKDRIGADMTVMPLIEQSEYRDFIDISSGAEIAADAGDRHPESLLHWTMAVNPKSTAIQQANNFLQVVTQKISGGPLSWLGESIAIYVDVDPFWKEMAESEDTDEFMEKNFPRLPVAFEAEVSSGLKLTIFLTALRAYIEQTAPGLLTWEAAKHNEQAYVKITPTDAGASMLGDIIRPSLYYVARGDSLTVSLSEAVIKRSLDRRAAAKDEDAEPPAKPLRPWLGKSMAIQADGSTLGVLEKAFGDEYRIAMQHRAWSNLPVLNEWHRRFADHSPTELHQQIWATKLTCPGGGEYVFNKQVGSIESTVYGCPAAPKSGPNAPGVLGGTKFINAGLTFENQGLRAVVEIERAK